MELKRFVRMLEDINYKEVRIKWTLGGSHEFDDRARCDRKGNKIGYVK